MKHCLFLAVLFMTAQVSNVSGQLRLPAIISSGMVLQQNDSASLWGWAGPGRKVFVNNSWDNRTDSVVCNNGAVWKIKIKTPGAGGPYSIKISSGTTIQLDNVMIGEVWVCSGQSNMEMSNNWGELDTKAEIPGCFNNNIHFFQIPRTTSYYPQDDVKARWEICDSNTLKSFSAVGYFFGKKLNKELNVPVGIINSSWGGTPAETWTPEDQINNNPVLKDAAAQLHVYEGWPIRPATTFNAMLAPITQYNIAGAIWYQGEANTGTNSTYQLLLTTMIDAWRHAWSKEFPFYYVQIAPFKYGNNNVCALLQEAQTKSMNHSRVGMVVTTDLVDTVTDIHPRHKREVGYRLANWALAENYHQPGIHYKSPSFKSLETKNGKLILSFEDAGDKLMAHEKNITGFYVSGATEQWMPAQATIEKNKIIVWNKDLKTPVHVRYGFSNTLLASVFSEYGLPLIPFRTDTWPVNQNPSADK